MTAKGSVINSVIFTSEDGPNEQKSNDDKILDTALNMCKKHVEEKQGLFKKNQNGLMKILN